MSTLSLILCIIVALEHLYIMYLETFQTASKKTAQTFGMSQEFLSNPRVQTLFKNQGIYNGLLAISLFYALFFSSNSLELATLLVVFVLLAALYGSFTSNKTILIKQGGPAILALISLLILH